ncbi:DinB family protein [Granulicella sibirica]|uniref:DinB family protein n=1 Tax=Granulicella sibirica TaxID=2479048 RepID=UPI0013756B3C|nr:DinB family protein [Granulicella sibirica]
MCDFDCVGTVGFFRERHRIESATTRKVLHAMTPEMLEYRAHPASSTVGVIAWTIVRCLRICNQLTGHPLAEVPRDPHPAYAELLTAFDRATQELTVALLVMAQKEWETDRVVMAGPRVLLDQPLGQIFWLFHADAIHHRGQISVFLRPFGIKVPSIYGPSGDCQPQVSINREGAQL